MLPRQTACRISVSVLHFQRAEERQTDRQTEKGRLLLTCSDWGRSIASALTPLARTQQQRPALMTRQLGNAVPPPPDTPSREDAAAARSLALPRLAPARGGMRCLREKQLRLLPSRAHGGRFEGAFPGTSSSSATPTSAQTYLLNLSVVTGERGEESFWRATAYGNQSSSCD